MAPKCKVAVRILIRVSTDFAFTLLSLDQWTEFPAGTQGRRSSDWTQASGTAHTQQGINLRKTIPCMIQLPVEAQLF